MQTSKTKQSVAKHKDLGKMTHGSPKKILGKMKCTRVPGRNLGTKKLQSKPKLGKKAKHKQSKSSKRISAFTT